MIGSPLSSPDVAHLGPVAEVPAVGGLVTPAHVTWVLPQQLHFPIRGPGVPKSISQVFPWTSVRFHSLKENKRDKPRLNNELNFRAGSSCPVGLKSHFAGIPNSKISWDIYGDLYVLKWAFHWMVLL